MLYIRALVVALLIIALPLDANSQETQVAGAPTSQWLRELALNSWRTREGLPHNLVQDIVQTPDGYLWMATWEGVVRFNGFEFKVFNETNTPAILDRGIRALAVGQDGALWLGTARNGLLRYHQQRWDRYSMTQGLAGDQILDLLVDGDGDVWAATETNGVSRFDGQRFTNYSTDNGLLDNTPLALAEIGDGAIWVATRQGISVIEADQVSTLNQGRGLPSAPVRAMLQVAENEIYVGSQAGLFRWDYRGFAADARWRATDGAAVATLTADSAGDLWVGTFANGVYQLKRSKLDQLNNEQGLPNNRIWRVFEDRESNIWIGTSGGLARLKSTPFWTLARSNGLSDDYVRTMLETPDGSLWVGTSNGLNRITDNGLQIYRQADGLSVDSVQSLAWFDQRLWVGTYGAGIDIIEEQQIVDHIGSPTLPSNHVRTMLPDNGSLWIGTAAGLLNYSLDGSQRLYTEADGLPRAFIQALYRSGDGTIWVGMLDGLAIYRNGKMTALNGHPGYDNSDVFGFAEDDRGNLWIATETGLLRYRSLDQAMQRIDRQSGLPHPVLFSVLPDADDQLWMSSNAGIFRASIDNLIGFTEGTLSNIEWTHFTEDHGLATRQSNGGTQPAAIRRRDQSLAFATAGGLAQTSPGVAEQRLKDAKPPQIVFEGITVDGVKQSALARELAQPARHLAFHYAGLHFREPENVRYRYRLHGYDEAWHDSDSDRAAHFTSLPPGQYRLDVQAKTPRFDWGESSSIHFAILPYWYQTWLAQLLLSSFLVIGAVLLYRGRVANLRQRAKRLSAEVDQRTEHLNQQTERLLNANQEKTALLAQLEQKSREFEHQAGHDALTGLPNRRGFDEVLAKQFAEAQAAASPLSVAVIDLDHFKRVNDQFSHAAGDAALQQTGQLLRAAFDPHGATCARYGGEEFVVVLPGMPVATAAALCDSARKSVANHQFGRAGDGFRITLSVGLSGDCSVENHGKLLLLADKKLYEAKRAGRNRVCY